MKKVKSERMFSEASPRPARLPKKPPRESVTVTPPIDDSYLSKVELEGGVNITRTSVNIDDLTFGGFVEGLEPESGTLSRDAERERSFYIEGARAESKIGRDERVPVLSPWLYPFNMICHIDTEFPDGTREESTGWFGGNYTLFTAGHSVYKPEYGGYARRMNIWSPSLGEIDASNWITSKAWYESRDADWDIGAVQTAKKADSFMGFEVYPEETLYAARINVFGFPGDKLRREMWGHTNGIARVYSNYMTYVVDTAAGQSGAPVFTMIGSGDAARPYAMGIHNYGVDERTLQGRDGENRNACTRINDAIYRLLKNWKTKFDGGI